ncbi:hypothetical protein [Enterococcus thailandicus]|uniref:hypothetical protein n=1 Tax=Enterococcus thailandicus TaxID=417368 RepID=UPI0039A6B061
MGKIKSYCLLTFFQIYLWKLYIIIEVEYALGGKDKNLNQISKIVVHTSFVSQAENEDKTVLYEELISFFDERIKQISMNNEIELQYV